MSRDEYADHMREGPAAGAADDDTAAGHNLEGIGQSDGAGYQPGSGDPAEQARGMTRSEYADYMRQGSAAGEDGNPCLRVSVVQAGLEDRTLGDTTPTGIGLKPTGEQLLRMEDDSRSYLEKLRSNIYERADDINDAADEYGGTLGNLFEHPPADAHTEVPSAPKDVPHHQEHAVDGAHLATAGLVVGVLGFELIHAIKNRVETWRTG